MIKAKELAVKTVPELRQMQFDLYKELNSLKIEVSKQKQKNVRLMKMKRNAIARVLGVISYKENAV